MTLSCSQNPNLKTEPPLSKVSSEGDSFGCHMYTSLAVASAQSLRLAQECLQHQYYLVQTVGHTTGSWCKGHSHTTGSRSTTLSPDLVSVKSHALFVTTNLLNYFILSLPVLSLLFNC